MAVNTQTKPDRGGLFIQTPEDHSPWTRKQQHPPLRTPMAAAAPTAALLTVEKLVGGGGGGHEVGDELKKTGKYAFIGSKLPSARWTENTHDKKKKICLAS